MPWAIPAAIPLPRDFIGFNPAAPIPHGESKSYERHLPHWRIPGVCYLTTLRLRDSIPASVLEEMKREAAQWERRRAKAPGADAGRTPPDEQLARRQFQRARLRKLEQLLDEGRGECLLRETRARQVVEAALHHFEGERCEMLAFAVMPNHVHALCRPLSGHRLEDLCGSWKWFATKAINELLGRAGPLWQEESFDRIIRDGGHYETTVRYIAMNPVKARLRENAASVWFCEAIRRANGW